MKEMKLDSKGIEYYSIIFRSFIIYELIFISDFDELLMTIHVLKYDLFE